MIEGRCHNCAINVTIVQLTDQSSSIRLKSIFIKGVFDGHTQFARLVNDGVYISRMCGKHGQGEACSERFMNFGQPKVTDKAGVKVYDFLPLTRVVDENDVVPLVPPITLFNSIHGIYEHLGDEVILLRDEYYVYLEKHDAARKSVGSFWENLGHESI